MTIVQLFADIESAISNRNQVKYLYHMGARDSYEYHQADEGVDRALKAFGEAVRADPDGAMQEAIASGNIDIVNEVSDFIENDDS